MFNKISNNSSALLRWFYLLYIQRSLPWVKARRQINHCSLVLSEMRYDTVVDTLHHLKKVLFLKDSIYMITIVLIVWHVLGHQNEMRVGAYLHHP